MQESPSSNLADVGKIDLMPMGTSMKHAASTKHKKIGIIIAIILATTITVISAVIIVLLLRFNRSFTRVSPYKHSSYFIPENTDKNIKYALFDKDGKNLTGFTIKSYHSFVDGYALVHSEDGWSIIGEDGKPSIKAGEYDGITRVGGLYSAFKAGSDKHMLIHGSGRIVTEFDAERNSKLGEQMFTEKNALAVAIHREDDKYDIYNAHGELICQINSSETPTISYYSDGDIEKSSTVISYNGGIIILANQDLSEVLNVNTPNKYSVRDMSSDRELVVLYRSGDQKVEVPSESSSVVSDEKDNEDIAPAPSIHASNDKYAIINNGNYYNFEDQCQSISISNDSDNNSGYAYCSTENGGSFIDESNEIHQLGASYRDNERYYVIDSGHYALYNQQKKTAIINNDVIRLVTSVMVKGSHYLITSSGKRSIYDRNGRKLCNLPDDVISFMGFDDNGISTVRASRTYNTSTANDRVINSSIYKEYLIDRSCNAITERYDSISRIGNYYQAIRYDNEVSRSYSAKESALLDKDGKVRIDFGKHNGFSAARHDADHSMIIARKNGGKNDLLNENLDLIDEIFGYPSFDAEQNIYIATTEKFIKYITPEGAVIYSIPRGSGARSQV